MACDAGAVEIGEHVVVMTSDTSLIVRAAPTAPLLTDLVVRQIVCKPELTNDAGKPTAGLMKDLLMLGGYQEAAEIDFVANNPGMTLFHCHQQLHMDFGFMTLFDYV